MPQDIEHIENLGEWWYWRCEPPEYTPGQAERTFRVTSEVCVGAQRAISAWEWVT